MHICLMMYFYLITITVSFYGHVEFMNNIYFLSDKEQKHNVIMSWHVYELGNWKTNKNKFQLDLSSATMTLNLV